MTDIKGRRRRGVGYSLAVWALCAALWLVPGTARAAGPASPGAVLDAVSSAIAVDKAAQEQGAKWEREREQMQEDLRQARLEAAWYAMQARTFTRYVETARGRVAELRKTHQELQRMEAELEGHLVAAVEALDAVVAQDMPFLVEERAQRMDFLHKTVGDYDLPGAEKLRRVLEAMQVELGYATGAELAPGVIEVDGESHSVRLVRVGRVGLFALAPGQGPAWLWVRGAGFKPLDETQAQAAREAARMLESRMVLALPVLPMQEGE